MAYEKQTWVNGDVITAEKMNHMEDGIADASGYECVAAEVELYSGTIASTTDFYGGAYCSDGIIQSDDLSADSIKVIFNGTEYEAEKGEFHGVVYYGAPFRFGFPPGAFDQYPFSIIDEHRGAGFVVAVEESSTNEITVSVMGTAINTSDCFEEAVSKFVPKNIKDFGTGVIEGDVASNRASGRYSHAEGAGTTASEQNSHAEGGNTTASGQSSHAEGNSTTASGWNSHAEGEDTTANHKNQHVFGERNIADPSTAQPFARGTYVEIVGNGTASSGSSNARTLDWSGNESLAGSLTLGMGTADEITVTAAQLKALIALLNA